MLRLTEYSNFVSAIRTASQQVLGSRKVCEFHQERSCTFALRSNLQNSEEPLFLRSRSMKVPRYARNTTDSVFQRFLESKLGRELKLPRVQHGSGQTEGAIRQSWNKQTHSRTSWSKAACRQRTGNRRGSETPDTGNDYRAGARRHWASRGPHPLLDGKGCCVFVMAGNGIAAKDR